MEEDIQKEFESAERKTKTLQESLDRHLEIYAHNGHALKELTIVVGKVDCKIETYHAEAKEIAEDLKIKVDKIMVDVAPLIEFTRNATAASQFINWIFAQWKWLAIIVVIGWLAVMGVLKAL